MQRVARCGLLHRASLQSFQDKLHCDDTLRGMFCECRRAPRWILKVFLCRKTNERTSISFTVRFFLWVSKARNLKHFCVIAIYCRNDRCPARTRQVVRESTDTVLTIEVLLSLNRFRNRRSSVTVDDVSCTGRSRVTAVVLGIGTKLTLVVGPVETFAQ